MVDADLFRQVMGNFAAGVTVVTLPEPEHGITVNAFASVSLDPTLILICIDHGTDTHQRFQTDTETFCVNILAADQQSLGEFFANMTELEENPFDAAPTTTAVTEAPIFKESIAYIDCTLGDSFEAGDHTIYLGEVEDAGVQRPSAPALTYFRGAWGELGN